MLCLVVAKDIAYVCYVTTSTYIYEYVLSVDLNDECLSSFDLVHYVNIAYI